MFIIILIQLFSAWKVKINAFVSLTIFLDIEIDKWLAIDWSIASFNQWECFILAVAVQY